MSRHVIIAVLLLTMRGGAAEDGVVGETRVKSRSHQSDRNGPQVCAQWPVC